MRGYGNHTMEHAAPNTLAMESREWRWLLFGCLLQGVVLWLDSLTPLGFAHGVLYALPVALGALAFTHRAIWILTMLGVAGTVLGVYVSEGRLAGVSDTYIWLNRALGVCWVVVAGVIASVVLRLLQHREAAHESLEQSAALLQVSSSVGKLGGWRVELPSRESHWSPEVFRLLGRPIGKVPDIDTIFGLYAPEDRDRVRSVFEACAVQGIPFDKEVRVPSHDGGRRWLRIVGQAVRDAKGEIVRVQGAIQDIADHKQVTEALAVSQAEWRLQSESLPMILWVGETDGLLSYLNRFTADYTGAEGPDLLGAGWLQYVHPDDQGATVARWQASLQSGEPYETEFRVRRKDGASRWHFVRAVLVELPSGRKLWYGTAIDIQDIRDEQEASSRLSARLAETMESVTDGIFVLDRDWRVRYLNRPAEILAERSRDELLGRVIWDEFPAARGSVFQEEYERCLRDGVPVRFEAEYGPLAKMVEVSAYPADEGIVVYLRDISEQHRLAGQLEQAQRMDSLGQLTGGVAHDFNNLLTVILGNAELLAEQHADDTQQRLMVDMIASAARRGGEMTQRLLAFARKQALVPQPADLNRQVRQFAPLLERALGEHIEIELVHAAGLWPAMVDVGQLEVALLNLTVNARDAMPAGGKLTIETSNAWLDETYAARHSEVVAGQYVMLAVSDTGCGMPPELLARVFEPFFTTKDVGKGTGLGLAMVYGFAKQSQGHVAMYSEVDRGTTVRIYLPRVSKAEAVSVPAPVHAAARSEQGELVLLVEDDEMVRNFARDQVISLGYRVVEAANGPDALRCLAEHPEIALLFTDVVMPGGMSGRQLADAARGLRPDLPVLYTSGYTENAIVHHGRLDPGVLLLGKPYRRAELADKLQQALKARVVA